MAGGILSHSAAKLCSAASPCACWKAYDSGIGIEILLGGELAIVQDHSADEHPDQDKAHTERGGNQSKWHGDFLAVASGSPLVMDERFERPTFLQRNSVRLGRHSMPKSTLSADRSFTLERARWRRRSLPRRLKAGS